MDSLIWDMFPSRYREKLPLYHSSEYIFDNYIYVYSIGIIDFALVTKRHPAFCKFESAHIRLDSKSMRRLGQIYFFQTIWALFKSSFSTFT